MRALVKELGALYRRVYTGGEERGLGLKDGVSGLDYVWGITCDPFSC